MIGASTDQRSPQHLLVVTEMRNVSGILILTSLFFPDPLTLNIIVANILKQLHSKDPCMAPPTKDKQYCSMLGICIESKVFPAQIVLSW